MPTPSRTAAAGGLPRRRVQELRGDLDAVLLKAMDRDPARRYATVAELQADLHRYLDGLPVGAHAPSLGYRLGKFVRRRALAVGFGALLALVLAAGGLVYGLKERDVMRAQNFAAQRGAFLESLLKSADPSSGVQASTVAALLDSAADSVGQKFADEPLVEASMLATIARTNIGLGRFAAGLAANDRQLALLRDHGGGAQAQGEALSLRGLLYQNEGQWAESEAASRQAVALLRPLKSPGALCEALDNLAIALIFTFREPEAEAVLREEIAIERRGGPALQHQLMVADTTYSVMLGNDLGRYAEAATYGLQAWEIAQQTLPPDHTDRVGSEQTYAGTLVNTHRAAQAEPMFRDVVARRTRLLGAAHHDTLVAQLGLAENLIELDRNQEAAAIARDAADLFSHSSAPTTTSRCWRSTISASPPASPTRSKRAWRPCKGSPRRASASWPPPTAGTTSRSPAWACACRGCGATPRRSRRCCRPPAASRRSADRHFTGPRLRSGRCATFTRRPTGRRTRRRGRPD